MPSFDVDHLLYAGPDLSTLKSDLSTRGGPDAAPGGRHANWGTHNALVGLGEGTYLELIAPEPGATGPWGGLFSKLSGPSLQAWCVRCGSADEVAELLAAAGVRCKRVPGGRKLADGSELTWELVFPTAHRFGGVLPFFIDWKGSVHPSSTLAPAAHLQQITLEHPDADGLATVLAVFGELPTTVRIRRSSRLALAAELSSEGRTFVLEGYLNDREYLGNV